MEVIIKIGKGLMILVGSCSLLCIIGVVLNGLFQLLCMIGIYSLILIPLLIIAYFVGNYVDNL